MNERERQGGWEAFAGLSAADKLNLYRVRLAQDTFAETTTKLRLRPLFIMATLHLLVGAHKEAAKIGLIDPLTEQPTYQELLGSADFLLAEGGESEHSKAFLEGNISHGLSFWEQSQAIVFPERYPDGLHLAEPLVASMSNLEVISLPIRNDLGNPLFSTPPFVRREYRPTMQDRERAWQLGLSLGRHLHIITDEDSDGLTNVPPEGKGVSIWQPGLPLFLKLGIPNQELDSRGEIVAGQAGVILRVGYQIGPGSYIISR